MNPRAPLPILLIIILLTTHCGINEKEKTALLQAQQAKDDSVRLADIQQLKANEHLKSALTDSIAAYTALINRQQTLLINIRTSLYTAGDQMTQIKAFHLGRLPADRESQIRNQEHFIQSLALQQVNLQSAILQTQQAAAQARSRLTTIQ